MKLQSQVDQLILRVLHLLKLIPQTLDNIYLIRQTIKVATKLGVGVQDFSPKKRDQTLQKAKETRYLLKLLFANNRFRGELWSQTLKMADEVIELLQAEN